MKYYLTILTIITFFMMSSCGKKSGKGKKERPLALTEIMNNDALIADTIIYPVTIYNYNPLDDWSAYRLRAVQREKLVAEVFEAIYSGKLSVYHYYSGNQLSIEDIKALESTPDFSRDRVEEIQFVETWYFSPTLKQFQKEVHSIVLAYAVFNEEGTRRGLKAAFRIKMEDSE